MTSAALTPAAAAMARSPTPDPFSPSFSMAASLIRAAAVRSAERMFSMLNARSVRSQARRASRIQKDVGAYEEAKPPTSTGRSARESVANGRQDAVTQRHQRRSESLVLGDQPGRLPHRHHFGVAGGRITGPAAQRGAVHHDHTAGA